jgi:hypothetical protein
MKHFIYSVLMCMLIVGFCSCSKSTVNLTPLSSLEIVNAAIASPGAQLGSNPTVVPYGGYGQFGLLAGNNAAVYVWPTGDSANPYVNTSLMAVNGGIYSLYLASANKADYLLLKDTIPTYSDSSCGIRFINLSPGSNPLSIDIAGNNAGSTVSSLPYKSITVFQKFSANAANNAAGYAFEIRNASDSTLLTTIQVTPPYFKNVTIAINGLVSDASISGFTVNNF